MESRQRKPKKQDERLHGLQGLREKEGTREIFVVWKE